MVSLSNHACLASAVEFLFLTRVSGNRFLLFRLDIPFLFPYIQANPWRVFILAIPEPIQPKRKSSNRSNHRGHRLASGNPSLLCQLLESYELKTYDHLCRLKATESPTPEGIVLVVVDQGSLKAAQEQGIHWPWPRQMYAPIIDFCTLSGARAVALDLVLTEPSTYGMEDDKLLADALKRNGHAFLPISLSRETRSSLPGKGLAGANRTAIAGSARSPYCSFSISFGASDPNSGQ